MADDFYIEIKGLEKLTKALDKFPSVIGRYVGMAGDESAKHILKQVGLQRYPPSTAANLPPHPYYIRGRGTQYVTRNLGNSEKLGTRFYVKVDTNTGSIGGTTTIGNAASYAKYVVGENQAQAMGRIGWRRLVDVTKEKISAIQKIYQAWVDKAIKQLNL